ncbi:Uncharacterised protein [Mycobacteroides abscessus subsp. abscessus]|nr:hypothetical protein I3U39_26055 [Mycobacteroides abscessus subsp. abscessus]SIH75571.1 Uncharacterised protein [Mycobacteroides abscessus subsp. abscessus]SIH86278.1 Uncharacterised protein [Mycobacteroides abscessus subsp. abscessus]SII94207.1 Uncharacterised protein [Mycobacteroides abscessus subsp. abscessus]SIJ26475.1 Uncharacterised protein [Mycobacteroides abscessus subsp. abscessus]
MTTVPELAPGTIERVLDDHRAGDLAGRPDVAPPRWAAEVDDWEDHGINGDNLLRACETRQYTLDEGVYVYALGMQRPDGTFDDLRFFIHPDTDGVTPSQARSLAAALVALAHEIETAK